MDACSQFSVLDPILPKLIAGSLHRRVRSALRSGLAARLLVFGWATGSGHDQKSE
jgi:hypothetical protein